jgi:hypothetical protein
MTVFANAYASGRRVGGFFAPVLLLFLALIAPAVTSQAPRASSDPLEGPTASPLFRKIISNQEECERLLDQYERVVRTEIRKPGGDAHNIETKMWRAFPIGTGFYKIALPIDGQPPEPEFYRNELEKLEKYLTWLNQDGPAQKEAYAKAERKKKERYDLLEATYQAFIFTRDGEEMRQGRRLIKYTIVPNPKYKPTSRNTTLFTRVRGTIWIDEETAQMAKIDGTVTEDISLALFLAKIYRGSHFMQERYEISPGIWEPTFEQYDFDGRKFLYSFSIHERTFYSSYKFVGKPKEAVSIIRGELSKIQTAAAVR